MNAVKLRIGDIVTSNEVDLACIKEIYRPWPDGRPNRYSIRTTFCGNAWGENLDSDDAGEINLRVVYRHITGDFIYGDIVRIKQGVGTIIDYVDDKWRIDITYGFCVGTYWREIADMQFLYRPL